MAVAPSDKSGYREMKVEDGSEAEQAPSRAAANSKTPLRAQFPQGEGDDSDDGGGLEELVPFGARDSLTRGSVMLHQISAKHEKALLPPPSARDVREETTQIRKKAEEIIGMRLSVGESSPEEFWMPFCLSDGIWVFDIDNLTDKQPESDEYPGHVIFEHRTNYIWGSKILGFLFEFITEFMDHITDGAMLPVIFMTEQYAPVPMHLKIAFVSVLTIAQGMAIFLAIKETWSSMQKEFEIYGFWSCKYAFLAVCLLEFLSGPEDLLDAPKFMTNDRNYGMVGSPPAPLISLGVEAQRRYMEDRRFLSKIPIILLEDVVLQGINFYMTYTYCNGFPISALLSISCSSVRTVRNIIHVFEWCKAFKNCKKYREARSKDPKMPEIVRKITQAALDEMVAQCPIL